MPSRLAGTASILAFAICLVVGGFGVQNTFDTVVLRALAAMGGTFVVGLGVGKMALAMLEEGVAGEARKLADMRARLRQRVAETEQVLEVSGEEPGVGAEDKRAA